MSLALTVPPDGDGDSGLGQRLRVFARNIAQPLVKSVVDRSEPLTHLGLSRRRWGHRVAGVGCVLVRGDIALLLKKTI